MILKKPYCLHLFFICFCLVLLSGFTKKKSSDLSLIIPTEKYTDTLPPKDTATQIFENVEVEANFPGGETAWRQFLEQNLNPNVPVDNGAPAGTYTVMIQFVVNKEGLVSNIKALTHYGYGMENEVVRLLRKSPPWVPAIQKGKNVNAYRKQPVTFRITEERRKRKRLF
jgi:protein TonB